MMYDDDSWHSPLLVSLSRSVFIFISLDFLFSSSSSSYFLFLERVGSVRIEVKEDRWDKGCGGSGDLKVVQKWHCSDNGRDCTFSIFPTGRGGGFAESISDSEEEKSGRED